MDAVIILRQAEAAGLTVLADGGQLVVRGPKSAAPVVEQLGLHKTELLAYLRDRHIEETWPWVLREWRQVSIP
ncbi:MAG: hypothetical protein HY688_00705, partial [Chloroflexi bacterium]|nr:hypothetical protein [Chloroflexota bacterium]